MLISSHIGSTLADWTGRPAITSPLSCVPGVPRNRPAWSFSNLITRHRRIWSSAPSPEYRLRTLLLRRCCCQMRHVRFERALFRQRILTGLLPLHSRAGTRRDSGTQSTL